MVEQGIHNNFHQFVATSCGACNYVCCNDLSSFDGIPLEPLETVQTALPVVATTARRRNKGSKSRCSSVAWLSWVVVKARLIEACTSGDIMAFRNRIATASTAEQGAVSLPAYNQLARGKGSRGRPRSSAHPVHSICSSASLITSWGSALPARRPAPSWRRHPLRRPPTCLYGCRLPGDPYAAGPGDG